ncbi:MAG: hypothetical protein J2P58_06060 [Acidimicrobiaceae bacterium]|nr:hypothetical protein [Acidimicrobiaceae bacterium]
MNDLLETAVAAHGGLDRWDKITSITVSASITGAFWYVKHQGDALQNVRFEVDTTRQRLAMDFVGQDKRSVFEPDRVEMQRGNGELIVARDNPERSFDDQQFESPWDDLDLAYFTGEALWTYLNTPFAYTRPGFATEEIDPIEIDGEAWRRLQVTFPDQIKTHSRQQISCFGPDGLIRRHDFSIDLLGGAPSQLLATDYRDVDGIVIPTTRRAYDDELGPDQPMVAIDMGEITVR